MTAPTRLHRAAAAAIATLLFALTCAVFLPIREHVWLNYDDTLYILDVPEVRAGLTLESLGWALTTTQGANWFPLTRISWMSDATLHGLDPAGFYATNLLLHAVCTALLFLALRALTGALWPSAFAAAVFGIHPLHVESVAWIAARKDPLSALFFVLALLVYGLRARRDAPLTHTTRALLLFCMILGFLAKPIVVCLPFVLLLLDAWPLARLQRPESPHAFDPQRILSALREKLALFGALIPMAIIAVTAQQSGGALASTEQLALPERAANAVVSYARYLGKSFWPSDLAVFYPHPGEMLSPALVLGTLLLLAALTIGAALAWRRFPALTVGWLWYGITLGPVIGLVQVGSQAMADRYMYLPLIGLTLALTWTLRALLSGSPGASRIGRFALTMGAVAVLSALALVSVQQLRHWKSSVALFEHALAVTRDNHVAHTMLGAARLSAGNPVAAVRHWREALRIRPDSLTTTNNLAWLLATSPRPEVRDPALAITYAERSIALTRSPNPSVLDTLAAAQAAAGRFEAALATLDRALAQTADPALTAELRERAALYRTGRAYLED